MFEEINDGTTICRNSEKTKQQNPINYNITDHFCYIIFSTINCKTNLRTYIKKLSGKNMKPMQQAKTKIGFQNSTLQQ